MTANDLSITRKDLIPHFFGNYSESNVWVGNMPWSIPQQNLYVGILPLLLLFFLSPGRGDDRRVVVFAVTLAAAALATESIGKGFHYLTLLGLLIVFVVLLMKGRLFGPKLGSPALVLLLLVDLGYTSAGIGITALTGAILQFLLSYSFSRRLQG